MSCARTGGLGGKPPRPTRPAAVRQLGRSLIFAPLLAGPIFLFAITMWAPSAQSFAMTSGLLCTGIAMACAFARMRHIARRGRRPGLVKLTTVLAWLTVTATALCAVSLVLMYVASIQMRAAFAARPGATATMPAPFFPPRSMGWYVASSIVSCSFAVVVLVTYSLALVAVVKMRLLLRTVIEGSPRAAATLATEGQAPH